MSESNVTPVATKLSLTVLTLPETIAILLSRALESVEVRTVKPLIVRLSVNWPVFVPIELYSATSIYGTR